MFVCFPTAALEIKHLLVRSFAGMPFQRGSAAGCRMELAKSQRGHGSGEGGVAGGDTSHTWGTASASERERELGKPG